VVAGKVEDVIERANVKYHAIAMEQSITSDSVPFVSCMTVSLY
jgi:hypothetical protein